MNADEALKTARDAVQEAKSFCIIYAGGDDEKTACVFAQYLLRAYRRGRGVADKESNTEGVNL